MGKIVRDLGFRWRKTVNNRKILIEKIDLQILRLSYLKQINIFSEQNRPIVYLEETYIHSSHTMNKGWSDGSGKDFAINISNGFRIIITHAGGEMGFTPNALLIFKSGTESRNYHYEMNSDNYGKWLLSEQ